jgi:hypothetical protein
MDIIERIMAVKEAVQANKEQIDTSNDICRPYESKDGVLTRRLSQLSYAFFYSHGPILAARATPLKGRHARSGEVSEQPYRTVSISCCIV